MSSINLTTYATSAANFLGALDSGEGLSTAQLSDALSAANKLLESWYRAQVLAINVQIAGFTLAAGSYTPATMPQFADNTTPLTLPDGYDRALTLNLAIELAPQYSMQPDAALIKNAADALAAASPPTVAQTALGQKAG